MNPAPLTLDHRLVIPPTVISRDLEGETVMLNLDTGIYFGLDPVGTVVWKHLQDALALREVRDRLVSEFDVTSDTATADLLRLAEQLVARGLVRIASTPTPPS
jgi:hypothetical protein